jgi:hypothetical protein
MKLKPKDQNPFLNIIVGVIVITFIAVLPVQMSARIVHNWSECAFEGSCDDGQIASAMMSSAKSSPSINTLIIQGAAYFLKSNSNIQLFLNQYELSDLNGVDYAALKTIVDDALIDMQKARSTYVQLISVANSTPYNTAFINNLITFDYDDFQSENRLAEEAFSEVKIFLGAGDVRGFYYRQYYLFDNLLGWLWWVKSYVDNYVLPPVSNVWTFNNNVTHTLLVGQYASAVFYTVLH